MKIYENKNIEDLEGEIWKDIPGYEGEYQVSNLGRVKSLDRKKFIKRKRGLDYEAIYTSKVVYTELSRNGYIRPALCLNMKVRKFLMHRLVAIAFIPNPENKPQVNHINGDKTDNRVENLEWATASENHLHAYKTGLESQLGSRNACAKLNEEKVALIKIDILNGLTNKEITEKYNLGASSATEIRTGKLWKHVLLKDF